MPPSILERTFFAVESNFFSMLSIKVAGCVVQLSMAPRGVCEKAKRLLPKKTLFFAVL